MHQRDAVSAPCSCKCRGVCPCFRAGIFLGRATRRMADTAAHPADHVIPLLMPGERVNVTIVRYLKFARESSKKFPASRPTLIAW